MNSLLEVDNLAIEFKAKKKRTRAVRNISFSVEKGETLCIVGESGCGKSITSLSVMGLLPSNGVIAEGSIRFNGEDLVKKPNSYMENLRGNKISMIFQEPMTALNPTFSIGFQLREPLMIHRNMSKKQATQKGIELLQTVDIPHAAEKMKQYPHELSGGMRQRVMIAMALACRPSLLFADEPTTALDVTIQAQILDLIAELKEEIGMGVVFVTHDMGVVAEIADKVMVMYGGEVVEVGDLESIFNSPEHPYTEALLKSVPNIDDKDHALQTIPGTMPNPDEKITGCRFHPRCPYAMDKCLEKEPPMFQSTKGHKSKCWLREVDEIDRTTGSSGSEKSEEILSD